MTFQNSNYGNASSTEVNEKWTLTVKATDNTIYSDAQITTYTHADDFHCRPPFRMTVRAYVTGEIHGTAGFGFWNHPFTPGERRLRLPKALWFFYGSPPNRMELALGVPGHGWKAATFDATRPAFFALLPFAPLGFLLMRVPTLYRRLWRVGQWAVGVSEKPLDLAMLYTPHTYQIDWLPDEVRFYVDGALMHTAEVRIKGTLGFIAWVDNQYAVVTPQGRFGWGLLPVTNEQTLILEHLQLESLSGTEDFDL